MLDTSQVGPLATRNYILKCKDGLADEKDNQLAATSMKACMIFLLQILSMVSKDPFTTIELTSIAYQEKSPDNDPHATRS